RLDRLVRESRIGAAVFLRNGAALPATRARPSRLRLSQSSFEVGGKASRRLVPGDDRSATIAFAAPDAGVQREQNIKPSPGLERKHAVCDFVHRVFAHDLTAFGAEGHTHTRVKQPQI